jgi:hypothetical protein
MLVAKETHNKKYTELNFASGEIIIHLFVDIYAYDMKNKVVCCNIDLIMHLTKKKSVF